MIKTEEVPFAVVQTIGEGNQVNLTVLPEHWTLTNGWNAGVRDRQSVFWGSDIMYWPINAAGRNLSDVADTDAAVMPDENCRAYRCTIKTIHCNRAEADDAAAEMQGRPDTEVDEDPTTNKKFKSSTNVATMFDKVNKSSSRATENIPPPPSTTTTNSTSYNYLAGPSLEFTQPTPYYCQNPDPLEERDATVNEAGNAGGVVPNVPDMDSFLFLANLLPDRFTERMTKIEENQNQILNKLSQINERQNRIEEWQTRNDTSRFMSKLTKLLPKIRTKLDRLDNTEAVIGAPSRSLPFEPVNSEADIVELDERAKDPEFIAEIVDAMKSACGQNTRPNSGWDVALKFVDRFGTREFFDMASWTGTSYGFKDGRKICLRKYTHFLGLFKDVVMFSDPHWTEVKNKDFFVKAILNNSKARLIRDKQCRTPTSRAKPKMRVNTDVSGENGDNLLFPKAET